MYKDRSIGVVIPAYNVQGQIGNTIRELPLFVDRIYVVDDGSRDNTSKAVEQLFEKVKLFKHSANRGPGAAVATGCRSALKDNIDVIVKVDGDGQMPPERIADLILPIIENKADYTKGDRLLNPEYYKTMPRFRLVGNLLLTAITRIMSGYHHINDTQNGFFAISRNALEQIRIENIYPYYGYLNDMLVRLKAGGFRVLDVAMPARYGSEKSSIRLYKFIPKLIGLLTGKFFWRLKAQYLNNLFHRHRNKAQNKMGFHSYCKTKKVLVKIGHPAHVHFYKNFIWEMEKAGHEILVCATDKDVTLQLLEEYVIPYIRLTASGTTPFTKMTNLIRSDLRLWRIARRFNPDIITGLMQIDAAHVSALLRKPSIIFDDTAHAMVQYHLYAPFASIICSPLTFTRNPGKKQIKYAGCHELAYLHPARFTADPSVLSKAGISADEKFVVLRFVAWKAIHDIGRHGLDFEIKRRLVQELGKYSRILISSEEELPSEFEPYRIKLPVTKILDLLYYATLYIGEGATMASECAVLGTPAIYYNPLKLDYLEEQEQKYGLVFNFTDPNESQEHVVEKALELIKRDSIKDEWRVKNQQLLRDKIDVTGFVTDLISNYPQSLYCHPLPVNQTKQKTESIFSVRQNSDINQQSRT